MTGVQEKLSAFKNLLNEFGLHRSQSAYIGDDVNDITVMNHAGLSFSPADAHPIVRSLATEVCQAHGGQGVAREVAEKILLNMGLSLREIYSGHFGIGELVDFVQ